ncbi:esterase/lipase family protein [Nocardioides terrisoli]|uniref:esterase/lipase family protein n=1 Tax=Nocardioides terrisoli TaxID=3388267 RepID=UPI00287BAD86|nr:hypothetical protein [Nocardioides marmorisolisilvae]
MRSVRALGLALACALVTALVTILPSSLAPAVADSTDVTPILSGGEAHWVGTATRVYSGRSDDGYVRTTDDATSTISWDTRILLAGHYPDDPKTPVGVGGNGYVLPTDFRTDLGTGTEHLTQECDVDNGDPDCSANITPTTDCSWHEITAGPAAFAYDGGLGHRWVISEGNPTGHGADSKYSCAAQQPWYEPGMWRDCDEFAGDNDPCGAFVDFPAEPLTGAAAKITKTFDHAKSPAEPNCERTDDTESCTQTGSSTLTVSCALCVTAIDFQQANIDRGGMHAVPDDGTFDGNVVRVTATVHNQTKHAITAPVRFRDLTVDKDLPVAKDGLKPTSSVTFPAGADTKVTLDWDTEGFAWYLPHKPDPHKVAVLTPYGGGRRDLSVRPKPVLLVHGWNSDASTWDGYPDRFSNIRSDWIAQAVTGMNTDPGSGDPIDRNARVLGFAIDKLRARYDAAHIDLLAHSMGGLISRDYLQYHAPDVADHRPLVAHLVMLGTPNMGSDCAYLAFIAGKTGQPTFQLTPAFIEGVFNHRVTDRRGTKFSVLAGIATGGFLNQFASHVLCGLEEPNDLVVWRTSAFWTIVDRAEQQGLVHINMTHDGRAFSTFVTRHLEVTPEGTVAGARAVASPRPAVVAARPDPLPGMALAKTVRVPGHHTTRVRLAVRSGTSVGALLVAPAGIRARLLDPHGRQMSTVATGQELSAVAAKVRRHGTWTIELKNLRATTARVGMAARIGGDDFVVRPSVKRKSRHRLALTVKVGGAGHHVRATALISSTSSISHPTRLRLKRHGTAWKATTTSLPAGTVITVKVKGSHGTRTALVGVP